MNSKDTLIGKLREWKNRGYLTGSDDRGSFAHVDADDGSVLFYFKDIIEEIIQGKIPVLADVATHKFDTSDYVLMGTHPARKREAQGDLRLTKEQWADAILADFQTENNRTKADEWEAAYAVLFKQLQEVCRQKRELSEADKILKLFLEADTAFNHGDDTSHSSKFAAATERMYKYLGVNFYEIEVQEGKT